MPALLIRELLEPGESLADASTWADEHSREIPGSTYWHFVNVPIWARQYDARDCRRQGCVVSKIADFKAILLDRNTPVARRRDALRFLVHLVQDVHQPLHVADRNDRGGNSLQLRYGRYDNTNLHQVWDSGLLSRSFRNEDDLMRHLDALSKRPEARDWLKARVEDWANESLLVGRGAYHVPGTDMTLRSGDHIGREYERENVPKAADRLARSGVRLAAVLEEVFKERDPRADRSAGYAPRASWFPLERHPPAFRCRFLPGDPGRCDYFLDFEAFGSAAAFFFGLSLANFFSASTGSPDSSSPC